MEELNGSDAATEAWHLVHGLMDDATPPSIAFIEVKIEGCRILALGHQDSHGNVVFLWPDYRTDELLHCRPRGAGLMHVDADRIEFRHKRFVEIGCAADPIWLSGVGGCANFVWLSVETLEPLLRLPNCVGEFRTDMRETMLQFEVPPIGSWPMWQGPMAKWDGKVIIWQGFGFGE